MSDLNLDQAVDIAARWTIRLAYEAWTEEGWETMPDVGEFDWERIVEAADTMLPEDVTTDEWRAAMTFLIGRAAALDKGDTE